MKIKSWIMAVLIIVILFGGIGIARLSGLWVTSYGNGGNGNGQREPIASGSIGPEDIRGSFSFADVATAFDIDAKVLLKAFGLPESTNPATLKNKDIEKLYEESGYEVGNGSVKIFIALYKNLPITIDNTTYLPQPAAEAIYAANPDLTAEQIAYLETNTIDYLPR